MKKWEDLAKLDPVFAQLLPSPSPPRNPAVPWTLPLSVLGTCLSASLVGGSWIGTILDTIFKRHCSKPLGLTALGTLYTPLRLNSFISEVMAPAVEAQISSCLLPGVLACSPQLPARKCREVVLVTAHSHKLTCLKVHVLPGERHLHVDCT